MRSMAEIAEELEAKYGPEARAHAVDVAGKYAKTDAHGAQILSFALATAAMVPEFRGEDSGRLYDCPDCLDRGFAVLHGRDKEGRLSERIQGCQRCEKGLTFEAAGWIEQVHPRTMSGDRTYNDPVGWKHFHRHFDKHPGRKGLVLDRLQQLMAARKEKS